MLVPRLRLLRHFCLIHPGMHELRQSCLLLFCLWVDRFRELLEGRHLSGEEPKLAAELVAILLNVEVQLQPDLVRVSHTLACIGREMREGKRWRVWRAGGYGGREMHVVTIRTELKDMNKTARPGRLLTLNTFPPHPHIPEGSVVAFLSLLSDSSVLRTVLSNSSASWKYLRGWGMVMVMGFRRGQGGLWRSRASSSAKKKKKKQHQPAKGMGDGVLWVHKREPGRYLLSHKQHHPQFPLEAIPRLPPHLTLMISATAPASRVASAGGRLLNLSESRAERSGASAPVT